MAEQGPNGQGTNGSADPTALRFARRYRPTK